MSRRGRRVLVALLALAGSLAAVAVYQAYSYYQKVEPLTRPEPGLLALAPTPVIRDRNGMPLRLLTDAAWFRHVPLPADRIPELVRQAFLAAEDARFYRHPGFDPLAILRAAHANSRAGHIVSGASTISQQLVKSYKKRGPRNLDAKLLEIIESVRLERQLSKERILSIYLNRVDLGNNLLGVETAALCYFGKRASELDPVEAATLAALPKAPSLFDPWGHHPERLINRRNWVLDRMAGLGWLSPTVALAGKQTPLAVKPEPPWEAPHLVDNYLAENHGRGLASETRLTVDLNLQHQVENTLTAHRQRLAGADARQAAAVIIDNRTLEVLASAGSFEYGARAHGFIDGTRARRSAGSTLKPFLYAAAIDQGLTPATVLADVEKAFRSNEGEYLPLNYDRQAHGPVNMRLALGKSLNLPAVRLLDRLGGEGFYSLLQGLDLLPADAPGSDYYGLGLAVGNPEIRLLDLAAAYAALANGGEFLPPLVVLGQRPGLPRRLISREAAFLVTDMLSDPLVRSSHLQSLQLPEAVALKTGTSTHYRDAWAVGFTRRYTVAVWVGNFEGGATATLPGGQGAGPIFNDLMKNLYPDEPPAPFSAPETITTRRVCAMSGLSPSPECRELKSEYFVLGNEPAAVCGLHGGEGNHELPADYAQWLKTRHSEGRESRYRLAGYSPDLNAVFVPSLPPKPEIYAGPVSIGGEDPSGAAGPATEIRITYPLDKDRYILEPGQESLPLRLEATVRSPVERIVWFIDTRELGEVGPPYTMIWNAGRGRHRVQAADEHGYGEIIEVTVE